MESVIVFSKSSHHTCLERTLQRDPELCRKHQLQGHVFEMVILDHIECKILTTDSQFGLKKKHGTAMCIYTLKNIIEHYRRHGSTVLTCFIDASRAFDRVNYWTLFN